MLTYQLLSTLTWAKPSRHDHMFSSIVIILNITGDRVVILMIMFSFLPIIGWGGEVQQRQLKKGINWWQCCSISPFSEIFLSSAQTLFLSYKNHNTIYLTPDFLSCGEISPANCCRHSGGVNIYSAFSILGYKMSRQKHKYKCKYGNIQVFHQELSLSNIGVILWNSRQKRSWRWWKNNMLGQMVR